jgi:2-succinyl-5-enolpyruvyl-6-hydroxy-3-cyclohexene-1-carboxylate synthase
LRPDCILRFGATPTSSGVEQVLAERGETELHVIAEHGFPDPLSLARSVTFGPAELVAERLLAVLANHRPSREQLDYRSALFGANERVWAAVDTASAPHAELDEPAAVRSIVDALPPGALLVVGNSLPVREVDAFVRAGSKPLGVLCQRGANGIDGLIAGAAGAALAAAKPTLLLLGDVSFAHDLGGLAAARLVTSPFAIVVLDNQGGRIFEQLPVARLFGAEPTREKLWLTPPELALEHAGPLFGLPYFAPSDHGALRETLSRALREPGPTLVHVRVPPHGARDAQRAVLAALERDGGDSE